MNIPAFKDLLKAFKDDEITMRAASVAFYGALSLAPMVLLFVAITKLLGPTTQERMIETVTDTVGEAPAGIIRSIAEQGSQGSGAAGFSVVIGLAVVLYSASRVMTALQIGLNRVWNVRADPKRAWLEWIRKRVLSMGMVLGIVFLLLVSMVVSTVIAMLVPADGWAWTLVSVAINFAVFTTLFGAMYKVLPDVRIAWKDVWVGALVTAGLFAAGKFGLGIYLGRAGFSTSYGAAGSLVVMLVWVYYSSLILFVGAEITQVHAKRAGRPLEPDEHAVRFEVREVRTKGPDEESGISSRTRNRQPES